MPYNKRNTDDFLLNQLKKSGGGIFSINITFYLL